MSVAILVQPLREKALSTCGKIGICATHCVLPYHLIHIPGAQCNQKKMRCAIIVIHVPALMKRDYHEVFRTTLCVSVFVCLFLS